MMELEAVKEMDEFGYLLDQYRGLRDLDSKIIELETKFNRAEEQTPPSPLSPHNPVEPVNSIGANFRYLGKKCNQRDCPS